MPGPSGRNTSQTVLHEAVEDGSGEPKRGTVVHGREHEKGVGGQWSVVSSRGSSDWEREVLSEP